MYLFSQVLAATIDESTCTEGRCAADIPQLAVVISNFLGIAAGLAGMVAVVVIIMGGFKYIVARGDPKATQAAQQTITWAVVGLAFLVIAFLVLRLIEEITGVQVTRFAITD